MQQTQRLTVCCSSFECSLVQSLAFLKIVIYGFIVIFNESIFSHRVYTQYCLKVSGLLDVSNSCSEASDQS